MTRWTKRRPPPRGTWTRCRSPRPRRATATAGDTSSCAPLCGRLWRWRRKSKTFRCSRPRRRTSLCASPPGIEELCAHARARARARACVCVCVCVCRDNPQSLTKAKTTTAVLCRYVIDPFEDLADRKRLWVAMAGLEADVVESGGLAPVVQMVQVRCRVLFTTPSTPLSFSSNCCGNDAIRRHLLPPPPFFVGMVGHPSLARSSGALPAHAACV